MLLVAFDVHAEIEADTPEIMHPEPLLHLVLDLSNQALISNDEVIIDIQNDSGNDYGLMLSMEHKLNRDHKVLKCALPNVGRLFQAIRRHSQAEYHLP
jgi:hypothetical protein